MPYFVIPILDKFKLKASDDNLAETLRNAYFTQIFCDIFPDAVFNNFFH